MNKNIEIKEPCSENWDEMNPTERGAYCDKCSLEVHDFTQNTGDEIRSVLKLNLGSRVCGRIMPSQLSALNSDFESWKMNSKRSFQSALVFSLVVAFGMTLFSCEEEEERKIGSIQQVGMSFISNQDESTFFAGAVAEEAINGKQQVVALPPPPEVREYAILGAMREEEQQVRKHPIREAEDLRYTTATLGGMGYSVEYIDHLKDDIYDHSIEEEKIEFKAFTFPNPARERTTLRVMLPKETRVHVQMFNMSGQLIQTVNSEVLPIGENNLPIDLLDLPNGTYILSIRSEEFKESVRFVKL